MYFFRNDPPFRFILWVLWINRSKIASAMVGSPISSFGVGHGGEPEIINHQNMGIGKLVDGFAVASVRRS